MDIICNTCGTAYVAATAPGICTICLDDRQWVPDTGQHWITPAGLQRRHSVKVNRLQEGLYGMEINPVFAIGQRALLVLSPQGNILWDCIPLLDEQLIGFIRSKGGLHAIALSHPHFYSNMNEWAAVFDCPVYIHAADAAHIMVEGPHIQLWEGAEYPLWDGIKIMHIGGHFEGSSLLHVPHLSPEGTIICGDTLFLSLNKKHFSVHYSSPNRIPLPLAEIYRIKARLDTIPFDAFYGYNHVQHLDKDAKGILDASIARYV